MLLVMAELSQVILSAVSGGSMLVSYRVTTLQAEKKSLAFLHEIAQYVEQMHIY